MLWLGLEEARIEPFFTGFSVNTRKTLVSKAGAPCTLVELLLLMLKDRSNLWAVKGMRIERCFPAQVQCVCHCDLEVRAVLLKHLRLCRGAFKGYPCVCQVLLGELGGEGIKTQMYTATFS